MPRSRVSMLAWIVAIAFVLGSLLVLLDRFNLFATPPNLPESSNLVDRMLGTASYRQAIWPVFIWEYILFAIGFVAAAVFAWALGSALGDGPGARAFAVLATVGGTIAAIASIIPIGSVEASVWQQYCDCGFKETEIVAGVWAQQVAEDVAVWLNRGGNIILAVALVVLVRDVPGRLPQMLRAWTWVTAAALVLWPLLGITEITRDPIEEDIVSLAAGLVLVPVWAVWAARSVDSTGLAPA